MMKRTWRVWLELLMMVKKWSDSGSSECSGHILATPGATAVIVSESLCFFYNCLKCVVM